MQQIDSIVQLLCNMMAMKTKRWLFCISYINISPCYVFYIFMLYSCFDIMLYFTFYLFYIILYLQCNKLTNKIDLDLANLF